MVKKGDVKAVAVVMVGVMLAGFAMYQFRDIGLVSQARNGYN
ncbi:hypothetical protein SAMN05216224_108140 [Thioclava dalianensis]|nr:hypothetical protein [Thioclava dalianensis]SFN65136.1 hypothetical protein SAMN05216224_108140 [Thioclava dalianensis]